MHLAVKEVAQASGMRPLRTLSIEYFRDQLAHIQSDDVMWHLEPIFCLVMCMETANEWDRDFWRRTFRSQQVLHANEEMVRDLGGYFLKDQGSISAHLESLVRAEFYAPASDDSKAVRAIRQMAWYDERVVVTTQRQQCACGHDATKEVFSPYIWCRHGGSRELTFRPYAEEESIQRSCPGCKQANACTETVKVVRLPRMLVFMNPARLASDEVEELAEDPGLILARQLSQIRDRLAVLKPGRTLTTNAAAFEYRMACIILSNGGHFIARGQLLCTEGLREGVYDDMRRGLFTQHAEIPAGFLVHAVCYVREFDEQVDAPYPGVRTRQSDAKQFADVLKGIRRAAVPAKNEYFLRVRNRTRERSCVFEFLTKKADENEADYLTLPPPASGALPKVLSFTEKEEKVDEEVARELELEEQIDWERRVNAAALDTAAAQFDFRWSLFMEKLQEEVKPSDTELLQLDMQLQERARQRSMQEIAQRLHIRKKVPRKRVAPAPQADTKALGTPAATVQEGRKKAKTVVVARPAPTTRSQAKKASGWDVAPAPSAGRPTRSQSKKAIAPPAPRPRSKKARKASGWDVAPPVSEAEEATGPHAAMSGDEAEAPAALSPHSPDSSVEMQARIDALLKYSAEIAQEKVKETAHEAALRKYPSLLDLDEEALAEVCVQRKCEFTSDAFEVPDTLECGCRISCKVCIDVSHRLCRVMALDDFMEYSKDDCNYILRLIEDYLFCETLETAM